MVIERASGIPHTMSLSQHILRQQFRPNIIKMKNHMLLQWGEVWSECPGSILS
jgi:hypothetical protein